jgi:adenylate cyclase
MMLARLMGLDGPAGRLLLAVQTRTGIANTAGIATAFGYLALSAGRFGLVSTSDRMSLYAASVYILTVGSFGNLLERRAFAPVRDWLDAGGPPTPQQLRGLLVQPLRQAGLNFAYWLLAAVILGILTAAVVGGSVSDLSRVVTSLVLAGLMSYALAYLLVEQRLRPVFALALSQPSSDHGGMLGPRSIGTRQRLLLAWALGSGIALLGIAAQPLSDTSGRSLSVTSPAFYLAVVGFVAGVVLVSVAASSVSVPLRKIEEAMRRVADGDLKTNVVVDDVGEIGSLQAGFNAMIAGLRERERLDDLFGRHVGVEVAHQALAHEATLGGEIREVSALFVDVIGSTHLALTKAPTDLVTDLNALFTAVVVVVAGEGGWVNKFVGDATLCVFGAPISQPDHATRALRAARALRAKLIDLAATHPDLDAAIGVSSGRVVAGNVGAEERYEYTVIGDAINEAARLTDLAKNYAGRVLVSETTVNAARPDASEWIKQGEAILRGRDMPTTLYGPTS